MGRAEQTVRDAQNGDAEAIGILENHLPPELMDIIHQGPDLFQPGGAPKFAQYTLPGGENYRELLFR